jgi:hypothetical protein
MLALMFPPFFVSFPALRAAGPIRFREGMPYVKQDGDVTAFAQPPETPFSSGCRAVCCRRVWGE